MPKKKDDDIKQAGRKTGPVSAKGLKLNASTAKLGFIYSEILGRPVSKKRGIR
jgi:hypothetical protein